MRVWRLVMAGLAVAYVAGCYAQVEGGSGGGGGTPVSPSPSVSPYFGPSPDRTLP